MKTVVFVGHTSQWSGAEIVQYEIAISIDPKKFRVIVLLFDDGPLAERLRAANIETRIVPLAESVRKAAKDGLGVGSAGKFQQVREVWRHIRRLRRLFRELKADIVHCNTLKADILGGIAGRLAGKPVVWHVHDRINPDYLPGVVVKVFRQLARLVPHRVIGVSCSVVESLHLEPGRTKVVYNGILWSQFDLELLAPEKPFESADQPNFGIVGRLTRWKGQHVFLKAAAQVKQTIPAAHFHVIGAALFGEEEYETEIKRLAKELGLENNVIWHGFEHDVPQAMAKLDALVHASISGEPFGRVLIEAMALERPVIATDGGGVPEIIEPEISGLLVPMNDENALAAAMLRLAQEPILAQKLGLEGRRVVARKFTAERAARDVEALWDELLASKAKTAKSS